MSLPTAVAITLACCNHRVPEPIRQADLRSREFIRNKERAARDAALADAVYFYHSSTGDR